MATPRDELHDDLVRLALKARAAEAGDIEMVLLVTAAYLAENATPIIVNAMSAFAETLVISIDLAKRHGSLGQHDLDLLLRRVSDPRFAVAEAEQAAAADDNDWSAWVVNND